MPLLLQDIWQGRRPPRGWYVFIGQAYSEILQTIAIAVWHVKSQVRKGDRELH